MPALLHTLNITVVINQRIITDGMSAIGNTTQQCGIHVLSVTAKAVGAIIIQRQRIFPIPYAYKALCNHLCTVFLEVVGCKCNLPHKIAAECCGQFHLQRLQPFIPNHVQIHVDFRHAFIQLIANTHCTAAQFKQALHRGDHVTLFDDAHTFQTVKRAAIAGRQGKRDRI